ncbi:hypothetical protein OF83DRAFT_1179501, partial [Amylostereum chailletii]
HLRDLLEDLEFGRDKLEGIRNSSWQQIWEIRAEIVGKLGGNGLKHHPSVYEKFRDLWEKTTAGLEEEEAIRIAEQIEQGQEIADWEVEEMVRRFMPDLIFEEEEEEEEEEEAVVDPPTPPPP